MKDKGLHKHYNYDLGVEKTEYGYGKLGMKKTLSTAVGGWICTLKDVNYIVYVLDIYIGCQEPLRGAQ